MLEFSSGLHEEVLCELRHCLVNVVGFANDQEIVDVAQKDDSELVVDEEIGLNLKSSVVELLLKRAGEMVLPCGWCRS